MDMGGAIFDWLRILFRRMAYCARHGDMQSAGFKAFIGLPTGDPASPILWNLFLADLVMMLDKDDSRYCKVRVLGSMIVGFWPCFTFSSAVFA
jgi:hypothetical protein